MKIEHMEKWKTAMGLDFINRPNVDMVEKALKSDGAMINSIELPDNGDTGQL
jgi:hypothetical protein